MKQLLIIRHAKSSTDLSVNTDFDRPLNDRGHRDAPMMAKRMLDKKINIDAFISSTAKRAFTTATYFADAYKNAGHKAVQLIGKPELYHPYHTNFYDVIANTSNAFETIALFSHNPGITAFANHLTNTSIDNMPTCGIFAVRIDANNWAAAEQAKKSFWFFDYPKNGYE